MSVVMDILSHLILGLLHALSGEQQLLRKHANDVIQVHSLGETHLYIAMRQLGQSLLFVFNCRLLVNLFNIDEIIQLLVKINLCLPLMLQLSLLIFSLSRERESHVIQECLVQINIVWIERRCACSDEHSEFPLELVHHRKAMLFNSNITSLDRDSSILMRYLYGYGAILPVSD